MKFKKMINHKYALLIEKDEMIIATLTKFVIDQEIGMAQLHMIGSITNVTLGYVPFNSNDYKWKTFNEQWELLATSGTISWDKISKKPIIHCHATISNDNFQVVGGHLQDAKVALKVEVIIEVLSESKILQTIDLKTNFLVWDW